MEVYQAPEPLNLTQNFLTVGFLYMTTVAMTIYWLYDFFKSITPDNVVLYIRTCPARRYVYRIVHEVPRRWCRHFHTYALVLELLVCHSIISLYSNEGSPRTSWISEILSRLGHGNLTVSATATVIASCLYFLHLCRRWYEVMFVNTFADTKMSILDYFAAYLHYSATILCLVGHSPLLANSPQAVSSDQWYDTSFQLKHIGIIELAGIITFLGANYAQYAVHVELANLRIGKDIKNAKMSHFIPRGKLFTHVSCPNILAELIIYGSLCAMHGFANKSLNYCTFWVVSRQVLAALVKHKWYNATFEEYPYERTAVIPNFI